MFIHAFHLREKSPPYITIKKFEQGRWSVNEVESRFKIDKTYIQWATACFCFINKLIQYKHTACNPQILLKP